MDESELNEKRLQLDRERFEFEKIAAETEAESARQTERERLSREQLDVEVRRKTHEIELERLQLEKTRARQDRGILRQLPVLLAVGVSALAVLGTFFQSYMAEEGRFREMEINLRSQELDRSQKGMLEIAEFISTHSELMFSDKLQDRERIRDVLLVTFPPELTQPLFEKLSVATPEGEQGVWREAQTLVGRISALRVAIWYERPEDEPLAQALAVRLADAGYFVPIPRLDRGASEPLILFSDFDYQEAEYLKSLIVDHLRAKERPYSFRTKRREGWAPRNAESGGIHVWLSAMSQSGAAAQQGDEADRP